MKNIYTYGGFPARRNLTVADIIAAKGQKKLTQVSAVTREEAAACAAAGIDLITIWDRDIHEVRAGAPDHFVTGALAMTDYHTNDEILRAAIKVAEAVADAVYTPRGLGVVEMLAREGLSIQGHLGLIPRRSTQVGGLRAVGRTAEEAMALLEDFRRLEDAGAYAVEVECVPTETLVEINKRTGLVTHSIGAGSGGDIIFSFMEDICGDVENPPRHAKAFGDMLSIRKLMQAERAKALNSFRDAVQDGTFPDAAHSIALKPAEYDRFMNMLESWQPLHQ